MFRKQQIADTFINFFSHKTKLFYIVEPSNWSIKWDGKYITEQLNKNFGLKSKITTSRFGLRNKILHFGSLNTFIKYSGFVDVSKSNKIVFTWFHITDNDPRIKFIKELNLKTDFVHTSCEITKARLIAEGLNENKIVIAPIGVDLNLFKVLSEEKKKQIRALSRQDSHKNEIFWTFSLTEDIHHLIEEKYRSTEMISNYSRLRAQNQISREENACLEEEDI